MLSEKLDEEITLEIELYLRLINIFGIYYLVILFRIIIFII